jgi:hypothetical protein
VRAFGEVLPWGHIDTGVSSPFLWEEYQRALRGEPSVNCAEGCMDCGLRLAFDLQACPQTADAQESADGSTSPSACRR